MKRIQVTVCTKDQYQDIVGIHLNCPDVWYLHDAIERAHRDGFNIVFCHYQSKGPSLYLIPYDVLNILQLGLGIKVSFTSPSA